MEIEKPFIDRLKIAFDNSDGDLYKFGQTLRETTTKSTGRRLKKLFSYLQTGERT